MRLCGAGVLPYCKDDKGELWFALAKERFVPYWKGSSRWSAFEGGTKGSESPAENAMREFVEESIGVFAPLPADHARMLQELDDGNYAVKVNILTSNSRSLTKGPTLHVTYVKEVAFDAHVAGTFEALRDKLMTLHHASEDLSLHAAHLPPESYPFLYEGCSLSLSDASYLVARIDSVSIEQAVLSVSLSLVASEDATMIRHHYAFLITTQALAIATKAYQTWFDARSRLQQAAEMCEGCVPQGSVSIHRTSFGDVCNATVNVDFVEKSCLRLWRARELVELVENRAVATDMFRPFFVVVLKNVLHSFQGITSPGVRLCSADVVAREMESMSASAQEDEA